MPPKQKKNLNQTLTRRPRIPRNRFTGKTGGMDTHFTSQYFSGNVAVPGAAQSYGYCVVAPPMHLRTADPGAVVSSTYQEYLVENSTIKYVPSVGTTTTGTIWFAYVDNPEIMNKIVNFVYSYADFLSICRSTPARSKSVPVWEGLELSTAGLAPRRKMFTVDTSILTMITDSEFDRAAQGCWVYATTSCPFNTVVGTISEHYSCRLKGLQNQLTTSV